MSSQWSISSPHVLCGDLEGAVTNEGQQPLALGLSSQAVAQRSPNRPANTAAAAAAAAAAVMEGEHGTQSKLMKCAAGRMCLSRQQHPRLPRLAAAAQ
jgi:hypothetical protein